MDFSYNDDQRAVSELASQILGDYSTVERLRELETSGQRFDSQLWQALADAGLLGVAIDETYGGMGFGIETLCLLIEEVGRTVAAAPVIPVLASAASTLARYADEATCQRYLPPVASGEQLLSAALIEPASEDPAKPQCLAHQDGTQWRLTGHKHCVPFAREASAILCTALTEGGPALFLLCPTTTGVTTNAQQVTAGEPQYALQMEQAEATLVVGTDHAAAAIAYLVDITATACASMAVGVCDKMMRMTASYTSERKQFGVQIATFQAVGHRAADCFIDVECLRLLTQCATSLLDQGLAARDAVLAAKIWTGDVCHRVSQASQHLHGGIGVDRDYPLFRYCLWARQLELTAGSSAALTAELGQHIATSFLNQERSAASH